MSPELMAAVFTGLQATVLVYLHARRGQRDELRADLEAAREEVVGLRDRMAASEKDADYWRDRYYTLLEKSTDAITRGPSENQGRQG